METIFTDLVLKFKLLVLASSEEIGQIIILPDP